MCVGGGVPIGATITATADTTVTTPCRSTPPHPEVVVDRPFWQVAIHHLIIAAGTGTSGGVSTGLSSSAAEESLPAVQALVPIGTEGKCMRACHGCRSVHNFHWLVGTQTENRTEQNRTVATSTHIETETKGRSPTDPTRLVKSWDFDKSRTGYRFRRKKTVLPSYVPTGTMPCHAMLCIRTMPCHVMHTYHARVCKYSACAPRTHVVSGHKTAWRFIQRPILWLLPLRRRVAPFYNTYLHLLAPGHPICDELRLSCHFGRPERRVPI
jgi:hypothetical protein